MEISTVTQKTFAVSFLNEETKKRKEPMHENEGGKRISAYFPFRNHEVYAVKL